MVGGGGKKKGKSGQHTQQHAAPKANNTAAAAAIVNKENRQPASEPLDPAQISHPRPEDSSPAARDDVTLSSAAPPPSSMETPVVSAAPRDPAPSSLTWRDKTIDQIPDFVPSTPLLPSNPSSVASLPSNPVGVTQLPSNAAGAPLPSNQGNASIHGKAAAWNLSAQPFTPTGQPVVAQQPPVPPYATQNVPYTMTLAPNTQLYTLPNAPINYGPQGALYKIPQPAPFYNYQNTALYSGGPPPPPAKHIMSRSGGGFEPAGYPQLQDGTININLNKKVPQPGGGGYVNNYSPSYAHLGDAHLAQYAPGVSTAQPPPLLSNMVPVSVPVVPSVPVSREPVNVSAAGLSDGGKSYTEPVVKPVPVEPAKPVEQRKPVEIEKPADTPRSVDLPPAKEKYRVEEKSTVKPVAVLKINSVMKEEEEGVEEAPPSQEPAPAPSVETPPVAMEQKKKKEPSPPVQKSPSEEKKESPPVVANKTESSGEAEAKPSKVEPTKPTKADKGESPPGKVSETKNHVEKLEASLPVASNRDQSASRGEPKDSTAAGKGKKPASKPVTPPPPPVVEKEPVKPPAPRQSGPPGAFNFNSFTNLGEVVINDADRYRSSLRQRSHAKASPGTEEETSSDPNRQKYSRRQLMELKDSAASVKLPAGFNKSLDIFSAGGGSRSASSSGDHMANYAFRGSLSTYKEKDFAQPQLMIHSVSLKEDVKLKTTENAWKPSALKKDPVERVVMDAKSLLNKLSPENFDSILKKFAQLQFSKDNIGKVIDLIIFKAVWEPKFAEVYARFIEGLKKHFTPDKNKASDKPVKSEFDLPNLLMVKCAAEFEEIVKSDRESKLKLESLKKITDEKEREEKRLTYEEEERLSRKKSVGVMTFIGELFKLKLLHPRILHSCFHQLINTGNDVENLECLAKLITSTGKAVEELNSGTNDHAKMSRSSWAQVMSAVEKLVTDKNKDKIPSRIRFMILDVLELRSRHWVPRMVENKPKTMAQIDKDIENEAMRKNMQLRDDDRNMPQSKLPGKKLPPQGNAPAPQAASQKINVDLEKFRILKNPPSADHELSLRPNMPSFTMFGGASGFKSTAKPSNQPRRTTLTPPASAAAPLTQNSFSALSTEPREPPAASQKPAAARPPLKTKPSAAPAAPVASKLPPAPLNDNLAFEKSLADVKGKLNNVDIGDRYLAFLSYGPNFTDKQDFQTSDNQYREEVNVLLPRCLDYLGEPLLSFQRMEKLYLGFVEKIEREVELAKEQFDPKALARSILLDLLAKRSSEHVFVSALLLALLQKHKKLTSTLELLKDFQIYCTLSDIQEDFPNILKVVGDIVGYLIGFGSLTLADYKNTLLVKYKEDVSSKVFVQIVRALCWLRGPALLHEAIPSQAALQEFLCPFLYRQYSSSRDHEPVDLSETFLKRYKLSFLLDRALAAENPWRVGGRVDDPGLVNVYVQHFVAQPRVDAAAVRDYLQLNFDLASAGLRADVTFMLTQKICYESLEPAGGEETDAAAYRLNEARFRELVAAALPSPDEAVPGLYAMLDVSLHLQLPAGLLLSMFVAAKEALLAGGSLARVNAPFKSFAQDKSPHHAAASGLARVLSRERLIQQAGYSKTSALPSLKNFYHSIDEEEGESEEEGEEGEK